MAESIDTNIRRRQPDSDAMSPTERDHPRRGSRSPVSRVSRVSALMEVAPHLPPDERLTVLAEAVSGAHESHGSAQAHALIELAPHVPVDERPTVITHAGHGLATRPYGRGETRSRRVSRTWTLRWARPAGRGRAHNRGGPDRMRSFEAAVLRAFTKRGGRQPDSRRATTAPTAMPTAEEPMPPSVDTSSTTVPTTPAVTDARTNERGHAAAAAPAA
jgi:hypothetical protein